MKSDKTPVSRHATALRVAIRRATPMAAAFLSTLLALPILAVDLPNVPLQSGTAYPAPNLMFILDDSGSMGYTYMPDSVPAVSPSNIAMLAYPRNTLSYNPNITYKTWIKADATRYTSGTSYTSAWGDDSQLSSSTDLTDATQTFYTPKSGATDMAATASYYRFRILSGGSTIERGVYGTVIETTTNNDTVPTGFPKTGQTYTTDATSDTPMEITHTFDVPVGTDQIIVTTSGGTHGTNSPSWNNNSGNGADLYVENGTSIATDDYECRSTGGGNDESCTIDAPVNGTWTVGLNVTSRFAGVTITVTLRDTVVTSNRCPDQTGTGSKWIDCINGTTPTGRSLADEKTNYATWYSYHRTRIKVAKAGASEAFSQVGSGVRVGYTTIWDRSTFNIPVGTDNGLFRDLTTPTTTTNKSTWYSRLHAADASGRTPLLPALQRVGEYYSGSASTGPWGPESGSSQISCRQSFAILTTDGYWNETGGYTPIGDADGTAGTNITNTDGASYTYSAINPYRDNVTPSRSDTLADVAMYYWKRDLRTTLENDVPASAADPAFWQHMVTFSISIGLGGSLDPATDLNAIIDGSKKWPNPLDAEDGDRIDDLWHAAVNGHGEFAAATNPTEFTQAISDAIDLIAARRGSASNVATNSTSFQSDTRVFQARYWTGRWTGELAAYPATAAGVASEPAWQASQGIPAHGSRTILTWNGSAGTAFPTVAQTTALDQSTRPLSPVTGANNALYIKGDASQELRNDGKLRDREIAIRRSAADVVAPTPLGDIVNSTPIFVQELQTIFVSANDGMLHAFNAVTGAERFAYVPSGINFSLLGGLSDPDYVHSYFVDGPIAVSTTKQTTAKNYLVGALGRGGKGVFGLDVTGLGTGGSPNEFLNADVLWERSSGNNMGYVVGEPLVVKLNNGANGVIVSNGINSTDGKAVLFVLNIATGAIIAEIDTGVGSDNGLFAPRGWDNDGNGTVDYIYAGDLKGNLWKFNMTSSTSSDWGVALGGAPLFVAKDASNTRQPITTGLALAREPLTGRRWVFMGTGRFLSTTDLSTTSTQSIYAIIDDDAADVDSRTSPTAFGELTKRTILLGGTFDGKLVRGFETEADLPSGSKGWFVDLLKPPSATAEGERVVSNPRVFAGVLVVASMIPPSAGTCDAGGRGFLNALDAFTGTSLRDAFFNVNGNTSGATQIFTDDILTSGSVTVPIGSVDLGLGIPTLPTMIDRLLVAGGSSGTIGSVSVNPQGAGSRRTSWREIRKD